MDHWPPRLRPRQRVGSFGSLAWSYDPNGNRLAETRNASTLPYVYSPPNWLYQKGSDTRSKTASGNTASSTAIGSFSYDGYNVSALLTPSFP